MASAPILTEFQVTGSGQFPLDMLRYEGCYPATSNDVAEMAKDHGLRTVTLHMIGPKNRPVTIARWASFLWKVKVVFSRPLSW